MKLGWIDFSAKDRKRAIDVIHLLQEAGAVDELGIGIVRDAFANLFFPGTSTVQTRAKYFLIIPYIIKESCENPRNQTVEAVKNMIDKREMDFAVNLKALSRQIEDKRIVDGVIGVDVVPERWVVRKPYSIYWNGIKQYGIFTKPELSLDEYIKIMLDRRNQSSASNWSSDGEENTQDDKFAGDIHHDPFWNLPVDYTPQWKKTLNINLTVAEAAHLKTCMCSLQGTLLEYILSNQIDLTKYVVSENGNPFRALFEGIKNDIDQTLRIVMALAIKFDSLVYLCRILYNQILSDYQNIEANEAWEDSFPVLIHDVQELDLDELFSRTHTNEYRTRTFLKNMQNFLLVSDLEKAKSCIIDREKKLKGETRAKLLKNQISTDKWIGGHHLDYRMYVTARLLRDIYNAEGGQNA